MTRFAKALGMLIGLLQVTQALADVPRAVGGMDVVSGKAIEQALQATDKKAWVVVFLSAKCPCSASHEAILSKLHQDYAQRGFGFIGVHSNVDESADQTREHFTGSKLPFNVIQDKEARLANQLGAVKTPHAYVIKDGKILFQGGVDDSRYASQVEKPYLKMALDAVDAGREPEVKQARALGCSIRRN